MTDFEMEDVDAEEGYSYEPVRIDRLEIENFKSYKGVHRIGPFKSFTAVIGPNGSGKSNLMDAISFVLGVRSGQLRGSLKELLYLNTASKDPADAPKRGCVKLILVSPSGEETELSRWLQPGTGAGTTVSVYKINGTQVTVDAYNRKLASYGILVKLRNFLVFQGDIEAVAQKSPMELTKFFEQISGSEALTDRYEESKKSKDEADNVLQLMFSKKKNVQAEKRAKKEQKEEAERYLKTQQDLKDVKGQLLRFKLKCRQKDLQAGLAVHEKETTDIQELEQQHAEFEEKVREKKAGQAQVAKKRLLKEKERQKYASTLDKKAPEVASVKAEMDNMAKRLKLEQKSLDAHATDEAKLQKKVLKLQMDLDRVREELETVEEEARNSEGSLSLSSAALEEYNSIKTQVQSTTSVLQAELKRKESELESLKEELSQLADRSQGTVAEKERAVKAIHELQTSLRIRKEAVALLKKTVVEKKVHLNELQDQHRKCRARTDDLNGKLEQVGKQMEELKQERRENERDRRIAQTVEELKENFPGVAGRMTELGRMPQQKYRLAITLVMQRDVDSVVVDTKETSKKCLTYLKSPGKPRINFIPLNSVKVKPIDERLRHLGGTAKLAFDLVEFDKKYERAFMFALGNSLVCDSTHEGQRIAYESGERQKVVTVDGVLYSKSGAITGGMSSSIENMGNKWTDQAYQELKKSRDLLHAELSQLPDVRTIQDQKNSMQQELNAMEQKLFFEEQEATRTESRIPIVQKHLKKATEDTQRRLTREEPLRQEISALEKDIGMAKKRIAEVADKLFADFSRKMNIANIREYEEKSLKVAQELRQRRVTLQDQETKISMQLKFDTDKLKKTQDNISMKETKIEEATRKAEQLKQKVATYEKDKERLEQGIEQAKIDIQAFREEEKVLEDELRELKEQDREYVGVLSKHQRQLAACEHQLLATCKAVWETMDEAAIAQISLKAAAEDGEAGTGLSSGAGTEEQIVGGSAEDYTGLPPIEQANKALEHLSGVDFESLPRQHQSVKSKPERDKVVAHYEAKMADLQGVLDKNTPNLKAVEQFAAIQEKERKQSAELEQARSAANRATAEFERMRQMRLDKFNTAFEEVSKSIDEIYKQLTTSKVHPMGGQAFLSLENPDEPFTSGIKYTAMPPTKRFRDMESLSGGEKTMAAVALLFATHRFRPSPFFVLDEVDAALDATNVARLAHYIRNNTRNSSNVDGHHFQSIVISLKDNFFEKADALVGVSRDAIKGCSAVFSWDLDPYGAPTTVDA